MPRRLTDEERAFLELQEKEQEEEEKVEVSPTRPVVPLPLIAVVRARRLADIFTDSLYGSTQATIGDYQETRARRQESLGHDDFAKELLKRADINEQQAQESAYQAKYGEEVMNCLNKGMIKKYIKN